jgi:hypothetical protein
MADFLDKKLTDVLEKLHFLEMVIRNLKERSGTLITDLGEVDERLFKEIANYEICTEDLKRDFVLLLVQDASKLVDACAKNINLSGKTSGELDKIEDLLDFMRKHESDDIKRSEELQELVGKAKKRVKENRKQMDKRVGEGKAEKREFDEAQRMSRLTK